MTHDVTNQPPPLEGYDAFADDPWLAAIAPRIGLQPYAARASDLGRFVASAAAQADAAAANRNVPLLRTHDRYGRRIDEVEYHPAYHALMARALGAGVHSAAWKDGDAGFRAHALLFYLWNELEQGTACPVTMTFASIPIMEHAPALARTWKPHVLADAYDPRPVPVAQKAGATIGMAMTEKQGGSDLRAVATVATRDGDGWRLTGHKWFCSAPMSDGFFTLARTDDAVTCFFVPRSLPDGTRNAFHLQRLKDKCGNRSNASSEIEYEQTWASLVGEPGRGIATLIEMAHHTRFDIVVGVAGMMRAALHQALHHASHRAAFGRTLIEHPLMANVLADLALEVEAATLLAFRLAEAFDARGKDEAENELQRVVTPIAKYWLCRRMTVVAVEAMECLGGNGYVEEQPLARLYREAPLNGIWEGSPNVICLDALRALRRSPAAFEALAAEIARGRDPRAARQAQEAGRMLADPATAETGARAAVERLALALQASLMRQHADPAAAEAFSVSRLEAPGAHSLGTLAAGMDLGRLASRARLGR
jgi:putative acyl-CoA dehydrogenase